MPLAALLFVLIGTRTGSAAEDPQSLPVSAAVKSLTTPRAASMPAEDVMEMARAEPPAATLPDERLPQYQMRYQRRELLSHRENEQGEIRFLLTLPAATGEASRPLLVRVVVRIDQEPFSVRRRERINSLLASLDAPTELGGEVEAKAPAPTDTDGDDDKGVVEVSDAEASDSSEQDATPMPQIAAYQLASESDEFVRRYASAIGEEISPEEADFLLSHWTDGPTLLLLHPYFQSFRANQRPVYQILDRDRDGRVSDQELSAAVASFQKCDTNRDDIVDALEIVKSAKALGSDDAAAAPASPLLLLLADLQQVAQDDSALFAAVKMFDTDQNGQIDASEIDLLENQSPDIDLIVEFDTGDSQKSKLTVVSTSPELKAAVAKPSFTDGVDVKVGDTTINFSAVQDSATDQVSLGAVVDGYPLLPVLDPNDDGRFTIRELRTLDQRLRQFDTDGDRKLSPQEATVADPRLYRTRGDRASRAGWPSPSETDGSTPIGLGTGMVCPHGSKCRQRSDPRRVPGYRRTIRLLGCGP